jgi:hypothetical protein
MKTSSLFSKIVTLACFIILLSGFVAYRSGLFAVASKHTYTIENDSTKKVKKDTAAQRPRIMQPSSKSGAILIENIDTIGNALREVMGSQATDSVKPLPTIMSSSKSIHPIITIDKDSSK